MLTTPRFGAKLRYRPRYSFGCSFRMAHHPIFGRNPAKPALSAEENVEGGTVPGVGAGRESDLAELAAKFAAHGGRGMSPELSAGLALDVVLNEIVEQACLATAATGAAIILERDGEMVCRASSGANAPELGARLSNEPGLTAECIKTRQVQRCDDAQSDPRADMEASRSLGVRSVMILPLLRNGELAGVLEVFSSRPTAFKERDQLTLEALATRILKNLERGSEPLVVAPQNVAPQNDSTPVAPITPKAPEDSRPESANFKEDDGAGSEVAAGNPRPGLDFVTITLGLVVLTCAVTIGTLAGFRLGWIKSGGSRSQVKNSGNREGTPPQVTTATGASSTPASAGVGNSTALTNGKKAATEQRTDAAGPKDSSPPEGSLLVYENGKEVFRAPPMADQGSASSASGSPGVSDGNQAGIIEVPPELAEGSLLHRVEPDYPEEARQQRIEGPVVLDVRTREDGTIEEVKLVSGQPALADAAIAAVKQWRFRPPTVKGQPVEMQTRVTLNFRLPH
jgi:TonB family protein